MLKANPIQECNKLVMAMSLFLVACSPSSVPSNNNTVEKSQALKTPLQNESKKTLQRHSTKSSVYPTPKDDSFSNEVKSRGKKLLKNGEALCEWGFLGIDLYKIALYTESISNKAEEILSLNMAKRVELCFLRALSKEQMDLAYTTSFKENAGNRLSLFKNKIDQLVNCLTAMKKLDRLTFDYFPKFGIKILINGELRLQIAGDDFAALVFELYLGDKPPTKEVKLGLLGLD